MAFIIYAAAALGLSAGFIVLQQLCMNHGSNSFVDSTCFSDSHTRALVSVYLTISGYLLVKIFFAAVNAYRVAQLQRGIEEGAYVAMAPTAPYRYQARAMTTRWWPAIAVVLALQHAPGLIQPLANLGLTTTSIYVRNNSTALIDGGVGSYNVSAFSADIALAMKEGYPAGAFQDLVADGLGLLGAFSVLTQLRGFAGGQGSARAADGSVSTAVVRANLIISTTIDNVDASNAFKEAGLVATVTAKCAETLLIAPLSELQTSTSQSFNVTSLVNVDTPAASGNETSIIVADVNYNVDSPSTVDFNMSYFVGGCFDCLPLEPDQALNGTLDRCVARATFAVQDYAFNVASGTVTPLGKAVANDTADIDPDAAGVFTAAYASASFNTTSISTDPNFLYSQLALPTTLPGGLFGTSNSNLLYSTLCTALSQSLGTLWITNVGLAGESMDDTSIHDAYTAVASAAEVLPLYNQQLVTHVPTWTAAVLVGALLGCMIVIGVWGMVWSHLSVINIKDATETALIDNVDDTFIAKKRTAGASNDPDLQMARAFTDTRGGLLLYARATEDLEGKSQRVVISNDPTMGSMPDKSVNYL